MNYELCRNVCSCYNIIVLCLLLRSIRWWGDMGTLTGNYWCKMSEVSNFFFSFIQTVEVNDDFVTGWAAFCMFGVFFFLVCILSKHSAWAQSIIFVWSFGKESRRRNGGVTHVILSGDGLIFLLLNDRQ